MGMMDGKVAVVTGSGGGIGREIAIMMAGAGAKVIVNDIGASLSGEGGSATPGAADQAAHRAARRRGGDQHGIRSPNGARRRRSSRRRWIITAASTSW